MLNNTKELNVLQGLQGLSNEVEIIVCTKDKNNEPIPTEVIARYVDSVETFFSEAFGGATTIQGVGSWVDDEGQTFREPNFIIQASVSDKLFNDRNLKEVLVTVGFIRDSLNQDCVSLKINGTRYFI